MLGLALESPSILAELGATEGEETLTYSAGAFAEGQILGNRYRVRALLGRGGMGEVWRATDLKLRVDVALKAMRGQLLSDTQALERLRQEVRVAREVVSPYVCRVFDLVELDGQELVSMEYIDGVTLLDILKMRAPLELTEARGIASQFLAGLEAIHAAGLVHRDVKPENLMMTRSGRVVLMDFGIAKALEDGKAGTMAGTPAYMAPELLRGEALDARADVFAAGVVLAEMTAPGGLGSFEARQRIWHQIHRQPPEIPDAPWAPVLKVAVAAQKQHRYPTAAALARALEEVTQRVAGAEDFVPYPGLASFTEDDAEYFFGRELEIEAMWRKLQRPHLLGLIGPSGAGKSSFVRAGLLPVVPTGWRVVIVTPGSQPFSSLARGLVPELTGNTQALQLLTSPDVTDSLVAAIMAWRREHAETLLVVDQFEELFTQNSPPVQEAFAVLLGRLALECDVHVLLSMRDDFLAFCSQFESLAPIFSELTPLKPLSGAALRRALVQPALKCGYKFEDDSLVAEMIAEVDDERGALPMLAFAASRLWEHRERERGLLTREAYEHIGGVAGALAQHAERILERVGSDQMPIVRELFRNLVTSQGTRIARTRDELLSVFDNSRARYPAPKGRPDGTAVGVLDALIDARLLTAYEEPASDDDGEPQQRIEIIHESLLSNWPRLVHWRTQDTEGAQLRDQLRQAAQMWEERGRPEDLLWTGTSFREYDLWRERYVGNLSASEETFARAMTVRATRRKQRRRLLLTAVLVLALSVASTMSLLWRRSEAAREEAVAAARHAEAQQLFAQAQLELEKNPTAALAYTLASLERSDGSEPRLLALRALWRGPTAFALHGTEQEGPGNQLLFSPDGRWLANVEEATGTIRMWESDGSGPRVLPSTDGWMWPSFTVDSRYLVGVQAEVARIYSLPNAEEVRRIDESFRWGWAVGDELVTGHLMDPLPDGRWRRQIKGRPLLSGEATVLGIWTAAPRSGFEVDRLGERLYGNDRDEIYELPLRELETARPRSVVRLDEPLAGWHVDTAGERVYTWDEAGRGKIWALTDGTALPGPRTDRPTEASWFQPETSLDGRWLAAAAGEAGTFLWNLESPVSVEPLNLERATRILAATIDPTGSWLATRDNRAVALWPLTRPYPQVLRATTTGLWAVAADPEGGWVATGGESERRIWLWPLRPESGTSVRSLDLETEVYSLTSSPRGDLLAAGTSHGVWLVPLDGSPAEKLPGFEGIVLGLVFDQEGTRLAAGGVGVPFPPEKVIRVWDLESHQVRLLDPGHGNAIGAIAFLADGRLLTVGAAGLQAWNLSTASSTLLLDGVVSGRLSPDGQSVLGIEAVLGPEGAVGPALIYELDTAKTRRLTSHGDQVIAVAWDPAGRLVVTGSRDGIVRVGPATGEEPHLLLGHDRAVRGLVVDPDGRWIVSASEDGTLRQWPMPDGPPLHTLPLEELLARLRSLTNFRVVVDASAPSGYRLAFEPFAGWNREPPVW